MEPKVSFIIPVYNSEKFLKRCVDSVLNQTYKNIEVILVNDGSTDNTDKICDAYTKNQNVNVIHITHSGAGGARNIGLKLATGAYISFVDSDDWIHPDTAKIILKTFKENAVDVVEFNLETTYNFQKVCEPIDHFSTTLESKLEALKRIISNQRFSVVVRYYKKNLVKTLQFQENIMSEDVYFTLKMLKKINHLAYISTPLYFYYVNHNSVSKKPYHLKKLDTLNSALFVQNEILKSTNDAQLIEICRQFVIEILLYHYKKLNYNQTLDSSMEYRKHIKTLINKNYSNKNSSWHLKIIRFLPVSIFSFLITFRLKFMNNQPRTIIC